MLKVVVMLSDRWPAGFGAKRTTGAFAPARALACPVPVVARIAESLRSQIRSPSSKRRYQPLSPGYGQYERRLRLGQVDA
jgi:hypothetical protein